MARLSDKPDILSGGGYGEQPRPEPYFNPNESTPPQPISPVPVMPTVPVTVPGTFPTQPSVSIAAPTPLPPAPPPPPGRYPAKNVGPPVAYGAGAQMQPGLLRDQSLYDALKLQRKLEEDYALKQQQGPPVNTPGELMRTWIRNHESSRDTYTQPTLNFENLQPWDYARRNEAATADTRTLIAPVTGFYPGRDL